MLKTKATKHFLVKWEGTELKSFYVIFASYNFVRCDNFPFRWLKILSLFGTNTKRFKLLYK